MVRRGWNDCTRSDSGHPYEVARFQLNSQSGQEDEFFVYRSDKRQHLTVQDPGAALVHVFYRERKRGR